MVPAIHASVVALFLAACSGATVQIGTANAPSIEGTEETRVHDLIANGRDACERSAFAPGEVLRGHLPPCSTETKTAVSLPPAELSARARPAWHGLGVCASAGAGSKRSEVALTGVALSEGTVDCRDSALP
jgi:hypothetical protein